MRVCYYNSQAKMQLKLSLFNYTWIFEITHNVLFNFMGITDSHHYLTIFNGNGTEMERLSTTLMNGWPSGYYNALMHIIIWSRTLVLIGKSTDVRMDIYDLKEYQELLRSLIQVIEFLACRLHQFTLLNDNGISSRKQCRKIGY